MPSGDRYFCAPPMKNARKNVRAAVLILAVALTGCTINRDVMFKTPIGYEFDAFPDTVSPELIIQPNDAIIFRLFANDGFKMIDLVSEGGAREAMWVQRTSFTYPVEYDGHVKLPLLGRTRIAGLTLRQAEAMLEERFTTYYNKPFVQVMVSNRRVVVFPGGGGNAKVVGLDNNNTTLLEVLAQTSGVNNRADVRKVKLFRLDASGERKVYEFDLSDIDGLKYGDVVMHGDDVVYVQPTAQLARQALQDLVPVIQLTTSVLLLIGIVRGFSR